MLSNDIEAVAIDSSGRDPAAVRAQIRLVQHHLTSIVEALDEEEEAGR